MIRPHLLAALAALSVAASAEDAQDATASVQRRVSVFQRAESLCKYFYLSNSSLASNFVKATSSSLSNVCECAAMMVVANKSDDQLAALTGAKNMYEVIQSDLKDHIGECMRD